MEGTAVVAIFLGIGVFLLGVLVARKRTGCGVVLLVVGLLWTVSAVGSILAERERQAVAAKEAAAKEARLASLRSNPEKFLADAQRLSEADDLDGAYDLLQELQSALPDNETVSDAAEKARVAWVKKQSEARRKEETARAEAERALKLATRQATEKVLRERFLDAGLDIKVDVSGRNSDQIKMTYVLFNDVWSHRMNKDGLIDELCRAGFKQIRMSDGYDWGVRWTCG